MKNLSLHYSKSIFWIFLFLLSSCGTTYNVKIHHIVHGKPSHQERYEILRHVYLLIHKSGSGDVLSLEIGTTVVLGGGIPEIDAPGFARVIDQGLARTGGAVLAYRVVRERSDTDPYISDLQPTATLFVEIEHADVDENEVKKHVQKKDSEGNITTEEVSEWIYEGFVVCVFRLQTFPEDNTVLKNQIKLRVKKKYSHKLSESDISELIHGMYLNAGQKIVWHLSPASVVRYRMVFRTKDDKNSLKAYKLSKKGKWTDAEKIWKERLASGKGNWQDMMNMGVSAELARKNDTALRYYHQAQENSAGNKATKNIPWNVIFDDLAKSIIQGSALPESARRWFSRRVAVLPLSNDSVSLDGPELIRKVVFRIFQEGGYDAIPLTEVDRILMSNGFTEGGQLRATTPEKISEWLHADWLIFGHIDDFNKINVGIYVKKSIKGRFSLWDAAEGSELWASNRSVVVSSLPLEISKGGILAHFLLNIATSWIESLTDKPMGAEALQFATINMDGLPFKPSP